ncbi:cobalt-precorrin-6A reductase [Kribbella sp. HUAS MG21]|uniref:Cobalt-precorrin-6A reductase n=1 Tax=Kribbella sp. HUAS MG21 TaxID=3160966 RepID=A0AAU7T397_9ACTN
MKVLLLGGTGEARELAGLLTDAGIDVLTSLAGRTTNARLPVGEVRSGGFGGAEGLAQWLSTHPVDAVVDATHPYAATMTAHAIEAARTTGVPLLVLRRPGWTPEPGDDWHPADSHAAAAELLPKLGTRVFLTIGRQGLDAYAGTGLWTLARCVDPPEPPPSWCQLLLARGPFAEADELDLLQQHRIDVLVTKNSGGTATAAKLHAARRLRVPVVLIRRPELPEHLDVVESPAQVVGWIQRRGISG